MSTYRVALLSYCLVLLTFAHGSPAVAARCDADQTPTDPVTKDGPFESDRDCNSDVIHTWQTRLCREALAEVRKECNTACKLFNKLDADEKLTRAACARDKASKTTATPSCKVSTEGEVKKAQAHCTATIACQCDP